VLVLRRRWGNELLLGNHMRELNAFVTRPDGRQMMVLEHQLD
jgi:hypothetical protein